MTLDLKPHSTNGAIHVAAFRGRMQLGTELRDVEDKIAKAVKAGASKMVLDMSAVDMLDSAALGTLFSIVTMLRGAGGDGIVTGANKRVMDVFKLVHADKVLKIMPDQEAAVTALS